MTQKEIMKLQIITQALDGTLTVRQAAELLSLSERQVKRLKNGVTLEGPSFVIHKNKNRTTAHGLSKAIREKIIALKETKYEKANFTHFTELLAEHEGLVTSRSSIQRPLTDAGIKSPKKQRKRKLHHRRKRKEKAGLLIQIDAFPYPWL
ncbi:MAG: helix-turn-helix domain-containing protein [Firmicutes bacterium]|nr:helix-turn-helix domain-containing protein [Bacillota bacterium]